jgi:hypothetical protein
MRASIVTLIGLLILALALRLWGLNFGLPHRYHIDEPPQVIAALRLAQGDVWIDYPPLSPNLHQIILCFLFALLYLMVWLTGSMNSPAEFAALYQRDPTSFYLISRGLSVVSSIATLSVGYYLVHRLRGRRTAMLTTFFLAVCFLDVRHAHFGKLYPLLSLLVLMCISLMYTYVTQGKLWLLIVTGLMTGIAIGLRYSLAPIGLVPVTAIVLRFLKRAKGEKTRFLFRATAHLVWTVPLGFIIGTPSVILNTKQMFGSVSTWAGYALSSEGFEGFEFTQLHSWQFYLTVLDIAWGIPLLIMMLIGAVKILQRHAWYDALLFVFPLFYLPILLVAPAASSAFARYLIPVLPFLAYLAAEGTDVLLQWLSIIQVIWIRHTTSGLLVVALILLPLLSVIRLDWLWTQTDTRTLAKAWIEANIPAGSKIAEQWHGPALSTPTDPEPASLHSYDVELVNPFASNPEFYSLAYYRQRGFDYVILSSFVYELERISDEENSVRDNFYARLAHEAELVAEFNPSPGVERPFFFEQIWGPVVDLAHYERPGPVIKIYRL